MKTKALSALALLLGGVIAIAPAEEVRQVSYVDDATTGTTLYHFPAPGTTRVVREAEALTIQRTHGADILVVNFWATWCGPCVAELPYFVRLSKEFESDRVRVVGYSVDLVDDVETRVVPFLRERQIPYSNVVLFVDANEFLPKISEKWGGEIPATFFYDREGRKLGEILGETDYANLRAKVDELLANQAASSKRKEISTN
jgi:thiol-disulfide isomerase/thioredoxin